MDVALVLFTEQGYERTSLREIAERLGVTKAALYYHFKSKEEIVASLVEDRVTHIEDTIEWARQQPPGEQTRREVLSRYADELADDRHPRVMRFFEQNQPALKAIPAGRLIRERMMELVRVLTPPDASPAEELRTGLALFALHTAWLGVIQTQLSDAERRSVALSVAYELISHRDEQPPCDPLPPHDPQPARDGQAPGDAAAKDPGDDPVSGRLADGVATR